MNTATGCPYHKVSESFKPFDLTNPFPFYKQAREEEPIFFSEELGYYVVTRFQDIKEIFGNWKTFTSENAQSPFKPIAPKAKALMEEGGLIGLSGLSGRIPPDHTRIRRIVSMAFNVGRFRKLEPKIRELATSMIDGFSEKGQTNIIKDLAYDLPAYVIFMLLGVPNEEVQQVKSWAESRLLLTWGDLSEDDQLLHAQNMVRYWNYCQELVAKRKENPTDDLPGDLVRYQAEGYEITEREIAAERDRITGEYRDSIPSEEAQAAFDGKLGLARVVFPYVENHNFYIEHWAMCVFWRKMRELSDVFVQAGFFSDINDMFYFRREEIHQLLFDYGRGWAMGVPSIGPDYLPNEIARRKKIIDALSTAAPKPAFNEPPAVVTEPFTIMLWGITTESVQSWLNSGESSNTLKGMAASQGKVEGKARVINSPEELGKLQLGEILVTRVTAPSWAPVFGKIKATVTDIGGMMSHAAIVCREYGLPAVTGTGSASTSIKTGDLIQVNGSTGEVIILEAV